MTINLFIEILEQGLIFSILGFGVYVTYKVLGMADMTTDGSFVLGGTVFGSLVAYHHLHPLLAMAFALLGGAAAGLLTGFLHIKLKISSLLSGIIVMTALYSVNLRILRGPNLPLFRERTLFTIVQEGFTRIGLQTPYGKLVLLFLLVFGLKWVYDWFFNTKLGLLLRTVGDNLQLLAQLGANQDHMKFVGLMIANALVSLSGALMAQHQRNADVNAGVGMLVIGLTTIIIGLTLFRKRDGYWLRPTTMIIIGAILYRTLQAFTLLLGLPSGDFKLISMVFVVIALTISNEPWKERLRTKRKRLAGVREEGWRVKDSITQKSV